MIDRTDCTATPTQSLETLMREAAASITPPKELHGQILAAVAREKRRVRLQAAYRRVGIVAAAVLILVPAVTLPLFRQKDAVRAPESADIGVVEPEDDLLLQTAAGGDADEPTETAEEVLVLFSTEAKRTEDQAPPAYATRPTQSTVTTGCDTTAVAALSAPQEKAPVTTDGEPAYYAEIRGLVGAEAFARWLSAYEGDPAAPEAEAAARTYFGIAGN